MRLRPPRQEAAAARRRESETKVQDLSLVLKKKPAAEKPKLPTGKYRALFPLNVYSDKSTTSKYEGEEGEGRLFTVTGVDVDEDGKVWVQTMRGWIKHDPKKMEKHVKGAPVSRKPQMKDSRRHSVATAGVGAVTSFATEIAKSMGVIAESMFDVTQKSFKPYGLAQLKVGGMNMAVFGGLNMTKPLGSVQYTQIQNWEYSKSKKELTINLKEEKNAQGKVTKKARAIKLWTPEGQKICDLMREHATQIAKEKHAQAKAGPIVVPKNVLKAKPGAPRRRMSIQADPSHFSPRRKEQAKELGRMAAQKELKHNEFAMILVKNRVPTAVVMTLTEFDVTVHDKKGKQLDHVLYSNLQSCKFIAPMNLTITRIKGMSSAERSKMGQKVRNAEPKVLNFETQAVESGRKIVDMVEGYKQDIEEKKKKKLLLRTKPEPGMYKALSLSSAARCGITTSTPRAGCIKQDMLLHVADSAVLPGSDPKRYRLRFDRVWTSDTCATGAAHSLPLLPPPPSLIFALLSLLTERGAAVQCIMRCGVLEVPPI